MNNYTGCYSGKRPDFCKNLNWYDTQPSECVNCFDATIFKFLYQDPKGQTVDPETGEMKPNSKIYEILKNLQVPLDTTMEFVQLYLFVIILTISLFFAFVYGIVSRGRIPNEKLRSDIAVDAIGFGNGFFPRLVFAIVFSYIVEGLIKLTYYRKRPNLTRGMVSDYDRWMGPNDFTDINDPEQADFFAKSKGALLGLRSHRSSFPSGHNTGAWTLFFVLALSPMYFDFNGNKQPWGVIMKIFALVFFVLAIYQFYARISLGGWHWPSDIAAGVLLGLISALFGGLLWSRPIFLMLAVFIILALMWYFAYRLYAMLDLLDAFMPDEQKNQLKRGAKFFSIFCGVLSFIFLIWVFLSFRKRQVLLGAGSYAYLATSGLMFVFFSSFCIGFLKPDEMLISSSLMENQRWGEVVDLNFGDTLNAVLTLSALSFFAQYLNEVEIGWLNVRMPVSFPVRNLDPMFEKLGILPNAIKYNCNDMGVDNNDGGGNDNESVYVYAQSYWDEKKSARQIAIDKCSEGETILQEIIGTVESLNESYQDQMWWYVYFIMFVLILFYLPRYWGEIYAVQEQSGRSNGWFLFNFVFNLAFFALFLYPCFNEVDVYGFFIGPGWAWVLGPASLFFFFKALVALLSNRGVIQLEESYSFEENKDLSLLRFLRVQT